MHPDEPWAHGLGVFRTYFSYSNLKANLTRGDRGGIPTILPRTSSLSLLGISFEGLLNELDVKVLEG